MNRGTKRTRRPVATPSPDPEMIAIDELFLDPINPRLMDADFSIGDQDKILNRLWTEFNVAEIVDSIIASNGFWKHEPLVAVEERGKLIVIEGNRRLAAVKLLLSGERQRAAGASGIPDISTELRDDLQRVPVILRTRRGVWDFIGYKHVKGPQEWDSIAKAEYIARIHEQYKIPLDQIAKAIGDRNATVERLYRGLKVLRQAEQAGLFDPENRFYQKKGFAYSHLWTGLGYEGIRDFLGIKDSAKDERKPVRKEKVKALGELLLWLYGSNKENVQPLVQTQNPHLRQLDEALRSPRGLAALRRNFSLQAAVDAARGDARLLLDALVAAEKNLREAKGYLSTGYSGQQDITDTINNIRSLAVSLEEELAAKKARKKK
jgi:hypothetical protein